MLQNGADVVMANGEFGTALQAAAGTAIGEKGGNLSLIEILIEAGSPVNTEPCGRWGSPLQAAVAVGNKNVIEYILGHGADVNARGGKFGNPIDAAASQKYASIVSLLLQKGAELNVPAGKKYSGPLQAATAGGRTEVLLLLMEAGADIPKRGGQYGTVLQAACVHGKLQNVEILVTHGADINVAGGYFGSAIQAAVVHQHADVVRYLLEKGAYLDEVDRKLATHVSASVLNAADEWLIEVKNGLGKEDQQDHQPRTSTEHKPRFQNSRTKGTRWDAVRGLSISSLTQKILLAEVTAPTYLGGNAEEVAEPMPFGGVGRDRTMSLPNADGLVMRLNRSAKSMPVVARHEVVDEGPDIEWGILTSLPAGEIGPTHSW